MGFYFKSPSIRSRASLENEVSLPLSCWKQEALLSGSRGVSQDPVAGFGSLVFSFGEHGLLALQGGV